ncbi:hypothetical protein SAMN05428988_6203 [Chitinophaga sp. YR573]|nr:hypothetical protein SAMN05428988_6203 [Chitinophaga sp. YR573]
MTCTPTFIPLKQNVQMLSVAISTNKLVTLYNVPIFILTGEKS